MRESLGRLRNQIEVLLEQAQIKLPSLVSDLLGKSGRRMLDALIQGIEDPTELAAWGERRLRATKEQLTDALSGRLTRIRRIETEFGTDGRTSATRGLFARERPARLDTARSIASAA